MTKCLTTSALLVDGKGLFDPEKIEIQNLNGQTMHNTECQFAWTLMRIDTTKVG